MLLDSQKSARLGKINIPDAIIIPKIPEVLHKNISPLIVSPSKGMLFSIQIRFIGHVFNEAIIKKN